MKRLLSTLFALAPAVARAADPCAIALARVHELFPDTPRHKGPLLEPIVFVNRSLPIAENAGKGVVVRGWQRVTSVDPNGSEVTHSFRGTIDIGVSWPQGGSYQADAARHKTLRTIEKLFRQCATKPMP